MSPKFSRMTDTNISHLACQKSRLLHQNSHLAYDINNVLLASKSLTTPKSQLRHKNLTHVVKKHTKGLMNTLKAYL